MNAYSDHYPDTITAAALVSEIKHHGIPTELDARNDFADFIARVPSDVLIEALNLNADTILFALTRIWDPLRVINFYNLNATTEIERRKTFDQLKHEHKQLTDEVTRLETRLDEELVKAETRDIRIEELVVQCCNLAEDLNAKDLEILRLKAKLYDLIVV